MDWVDALMLAILALLTLLIGMYTTRGGIHWIPLYVGLTFFLFCNVFRIGNRLEPCWYVPFTIIAAYALYTLNLEFFWGAVVWILEPLKWLLIALSIVKGPYRGIFSRAGAYTIAGEAAQADAAAAAGGTSQQRK